MSTSISQPGVNETILSLDFKAHILAVMARHPKELEEAISILTASYDLSIKTAS